MWIPTGDLPVLILKLALGTLAFGLAVLLAEWELTRRLILWLSRLTYRE